MDRDAIDPEQVRAEFQDRYLRDLESGHIRSLSVYQREFPDHEGTVAEEWSFLEEDENGDEFRHLGPYRILEELGRGAQATVYRAEHRELGREAALKVLHTAALGLGPERSRFRREAEVTSRLEHPAICSVFETGENDGFSWIAMRLVHGQTLADRIAQARRAAAQELDLSLDSSNASTNRGSTMRIVGFIAECARALHVAHEQGLIHRDIKPGNIVVTPEGTPVVLDFGLARDEASTASLTQSSSGPMGTPYYMSPEQVRAREPVDRRTDVYSLGVTLFECLTLRRPFEAPDREALYRQILLGDPPDVRTLQPKVPRELAVVLATAVDRDASRRYATALALAEDLERVRNYESIQARPMPRLLRARRWVQRNPAASVVLVVVSAALVLTTALAVVIANGRAETERALRTSRANTLIYASEEQIDKDPTLALLLANEAVALEDRLGTRTQLHRVLTESHPVAVLDIPEHSRLQLRSALISDDGQRVALLGWVHGPVTVWDLANGEHATYEPGGINRMFGSPKLDRLFVWSSKRTGVFLNSACEPVPDSQALTGVSQVTPFGDGVLVAFQNRTIARFDWDGRRLDESTLEGRVNCLAKHGDAVALGTNRGAVVTLEESSGATETFTVPGWTAAPKPLFSVALSADFVVARSGPQADERFDERFWVWNRSSGECLELPPIEGSAQSAGHCLHAEISPRGDRMLTIHDVAPEARLWVLERGRVTRGIALRAPGPDMGQIPRYAVDGGVPEITEKVLRPVARPAPQFAPDGDWLFTLKMDDTHGRLCAWSADGDLEWVRNVFQHCVRFAPSGDLVYQDKWFGAVAIDREQRTRWERRGHTNALHDAVFSTKGRLVTVSHDGTARVWDSRAHGQELIRNEPAKPVFALLRLDERTVLGVLGQGQAFLLRDGALVTRFELPCEPAPPPYFDRFAASPDGERFVSIDSSTGLGFALHEARTGREIRSFTVGKIIHDIAYDPDGRSVLLACEDGPHRCDLDGSGRMTPLEGFPAGRVGKTVCDVAPDGRTAVAIGITGQVWLDGKLLPLPSDAGRHVGQGHVVFALDVAFSATGALALAMSDGRLLTFDSTGRFDWEGFVDQPLMWLNWSPDGSRLAAGFVSEFSVWDAASPTPIETLRPRDFIIGAATFESNDTMLVPHIDGTLRRWSLRPDVGRRLVRDFTPEERGRYLPWK